MFVHCFGQKKNNKIKGLMMILIETSNIFTVEFYSKVSEKSNFKLSPISSSRHFWRRFFFSRGEVVNPRENLINYLLYASFHWKLKDHWRHEEIFVSRITLLEHDRLNKKPRGALVSSRSCASLLFEIAQWQIWITSSISPI